MPTCSNYVQSLNLKKASQYGEVRIELDHNLYQTE